MPAPNAKIGAANCLKFAIFAYMEPDQNYRRTSTIPSGGHIDLRLFVFVFHIAVPHRSVRLII